MPATRKVRLKVQLTRPVTDKSQAYWRCPSRGCQHYQYVLVGLHPEKLEAKIECPICRLRYDVSCLYRAGGDMFVLAELQERGKLQVELVESGTNAPDRP